MNPEDLFTLYAAGIPGPKPLLNRLGSFGLVQIRVYVVCIKSEDMGKLLRH